jgi:hypothetical protein
MGPLREGWAVYGCGVPVAFPAPLGWGCRRGPLEGRTMACCPSVARPRRRREGRLPAAVRADRPAHRGRLPDPRRAPSQARGRTGEARGGAVLDRRDGRRAGVPRAGPLQPAERAVTARARHPRAAGHRKRQPFRQQHQGLYAEAIGRPERSVNREVAAARVAASSPMWASLAEHTRHLAELHAAVSWLWPALVVRLLAEGWTVDNARSHAGRLKDVPEPPAWADQEGNVDKLVTRLMRGGDVAVCSRSPPMPVPGSPRWIRRYTALAGISLIRSSGSAAGVARW